MKKILSPLMAAALVSGLSMGNIALANEGEAAHAEAPAKAGKKAKKKAKGKKHAKKEHKKDHGCGKDGNGCEHAQEHGAEGGEGEQAE